MSTPILTYARLKTRRRWRWVVIGLVSAIAIGVWWKYGAAVRQYVSDWRSARAYASQFDAVAALAADGRPFVWNGDPERNAHAIDLLKKLSGNRPAAPGETLPTVYFIRTGPRDQHGDAWVVVGFDSQGALGTTAFLRDGWKMPAGYTSTMMSRRPYKLIRMMPMNEDGSFDMVVDINGTENAITWSPVNALMGIKVRPTLPHYSTRATTGTWFNERWEPLKKDVTLRTAVRPPTTLPSVWGMMAMAFEADGTIRLEDDKRYNHVSPQTGEKTPYTYFRIRRSRVSDRVDDTKPRWVADSENYYLSTNSGKTVFYRRGGDAVATLPDVGCVMRGSISPNERWILLSGLPETLLFDVATKQEVWRTQTMWASQGAICWTPDSRLGVLAIGHGVYVWNTDLPRTITYHPHKMASIDPVVAISPDGKRLAVTKDGGVISYWADLPAATQPVSP